MKSTSTKHGQVPGWRRRWCLCAFIRLPTITTFAMYYFTPTHQRWWPMPISSTRLAVYIGICALCLNVRFDCVPDERYAAAVEFGCCAPLIKSFHGKKGCEKQNESTLFRVGQIQLWLWILKWSRRECDAISFSLSFPFPRICGQSSRPSDRVVSIENNETHMNVVQFDAKSLILVCGGIVWVAASLAVAQNACRSFVCMHDVSASVSSGPDTVNSPVRIHTIQLLARTHSFHFNKWISLWID